MDIKDSRLLKFKGLLFLLLGILSGGMILAQVPDWKVLGLLMVCIWAFCRFYYFAFYVLEHYADPDFRYAGLGDLMKYLLRKKR
ncbi:MAG: hypothetical protein MUF31_15080 [Akkermansiaceae bacterium]|jgi:hypothetical protein|nr:hypothetical protein [Akkermansiaceae bacterium]